MYEILHSFEQAAALFEPVVLITAGVIILVAGLAVWLAGLRYAVLVAAAVGALICGLVGFHAAGGVQAVGWLFAILGGLVAIAVRRYLLGGAAVFVAAMIALTILAPASETPAPEVPEQVEQKLGPADATQVTAGYLDHIVAEYRYAIGHLAGWQWAVVAAVAAIALAVAIVLLRVAVAALCASLGSGLIFAGMTLLLIFKGTEPIARIAARSGYYASLAAGMMGIGLAVQLLLYRPPAKKKKKKKDEDSDDDEDGEKKSGWRTM